MHYKRFQGQLDAIPILKPKPKNFPLFNGELIFDVAPTQSYSESKPWLEMINDDYVKMISHWLLS